MSLHRQLFYGWHNIEIRTIFRHVLQHAGKSAICSCLICLDGAHSLDKCDILRYAMLSYNFGSNRRYQPSYSQSRRNTYFPKRYRYSSYWRPWESLPDYHCYRQRCNTSSDCCRRHNICDPYVKVCHDCWHGYKCQTSGDCCSRYPYCHPHKKECYN
ncbi:uncharacterized protein LOC125679168 isoform X3 [Ostrea edulis]|uniref:uncharacterized protein LOC125679168 isoform X3 n=1 Tax=Ostrea edulis TaxID=37623 RepID=UPI0024AF08A7|nr:uncharacterized protein LOC125679168 isoform X3 [Ostrea edulis]